MALWDQWWVWMSAALILGTLEILLPINFFVGLAGGATIIGLILLTGFSFGSLPVTLVVYGIMSLIGVLALRRLLGQNKGQVKIWDRDIND